MAIIVNKEEKRREMALSCKSLLLEQGIHNITISQLATRAKVGKGTIYEYFENKEDIVFEIIRSFIVEFEERLLEVVESYEDTKEKLYHFFALIFEDPIYESQRVIYQEFLAISLTQGTDKMTEFSIDCKKRFRHILLDIIQKAVDSGDIKSVALDLIPSMLIFHKGLIVDSVVSSTAVSVEIRLYVDTLLGLITEEGV